MIKQCILFFSIRRGGTNAVARWLNNQSPSHMIELNGFDPLPHQSHDIFPFKNEEGFKNAEKSERLLVKYENLDFTFKFPFKTYTQKGVIEYTDMFPKCEKFKNVVLLRDFINWSASYHGNTARDLSVHRWRTQLWVKYAKEILKETSYLSDPLFINYDKWFISKEYRMSICQSLDLDFNDNGINNVPINGNGSSFDERRYDNRAQEMDVLERWKLITDKNFSKYIESPCAISMSKKIFGEIIDHEQAIKEIKGITGH